MSARWAVGALIALACGGGNGGGTTDSSNNGTTPYGTNNSIVDCNLMPEYDVDGMDCEELADAFYGQADGDAATVCDSDDDCRAIKTPCEHWDAVSGCYWVVNFCFTDSMLSEYDALSDGCFVKTGIRQNSCECGGVGIPEVQCKNNKCSEVFDYPY